MPKQATELMQRMRQTEKLGEKIDTDIKTLAVEMDKSSNRIALGLLITAFLISSALIWSFGQPMLFGLPAFSLIGFAMAFFLLFVLTMSIAREKL